MLRHRQLWTIVLAAGEGSRLAHLTTNLYASPRPKQFAVLRGQRSLLQTTLDRLAPISREERTVVVVPRQHEELAREQLAEWPRARVVVQPENRGTGPGILLPLSQVLVEDPDADVVIAPSDHHVENPDPLLAGILDAREALNRVPLSLVGVRATSPETEYGWICAGKVRHGRVHALRHFVEKPSRDRAEALLARRALWNTFLMVGSGAHVWERAARRMPAQARAIADSPRGERLDRAYRAMREANFSRDVLEGGGTKLGVVPVEGSGWTDWGSPQRVIASLPHGPDRARIESAAA